MEWVAQASGTVPILDVFQGCMDEALRDVVQWWDLVILMAFSNLNIPIIL